MAKQRYEIEYAQEAVDDVDVLRAFDQRRILDGIEQHLGLQPTKVSRTRIKQMLQPFWSQYRLRVDEFRVYYDVDEDEHEVNVLRILAKESSETPEEPSP